MKRVLIMLVKALLALALPVLAADNLELEKAKTMFRDGRIDDAVGLLERLVATSTLSQSDRVEALEVLAYCNVAKQREDQVQRSFAQILQVDAAYEPRDTYLSHPAVMRAWLNARKQVVGNFAMAPSSTIKTIAILDFDNNSLEDADKLANLGKGLADILISDLGMLTKLKVVERERIQFILDEIQRSDATVNGQRMADPEFAVRVGKLVGAQSMLVGSYLKFGNKLRLDTRLVKTETSEIIKTESVEGKPDEIFELSKKLAIKISEDLEVAINKAEEENLERIRKDEIPLEAAMAYSEALNMLDQERYQDARKMLNKALTIAPSFRMARNKLALLETFQKG
ncbi:MAG: CsgG/HfaB family protein [bacterium]